MNKFIISMIVFFTMNGLQCFAADTNQIQAKKSDEYYMQIAIDLAKSNPKAPFAALIVDNITGKILSKGLNASKVFMGRWWRSTIALKNILGWIGHK